MSDESESSVFQETTSSKRPSSRLRSQVFLGLYPVFLGMAPVLGKLAYNGGSDPFTVAALRTTVAAALLWVTYLLFWRRFIYVYPAGLLGCVVVGTVNGIGSLFYYNGLSYLSASVAQLLNATYIIFVVVLSLGGGQSLTRRTITRVMLALLAIVLITGGVRGQIDWRGAGLMIGNALLFAGTVVLSQRVLYEMPSQTVALYVITTMAVVVVMARVVYRLEWIPQTGEAVAAIFALGLTTALSRLIMFFSVKKMGSLQTVLIGISETAATLILAAFILHDALTPFQWAGVALLGFSLMLLRWHEVDKLATGEIPVLHVSGLGFDPTTFNHIAFRRAFGIPGSDRFDDVTPDEMAMIRRMMEARPRND